MREPPTLKKRKSGTLPPEKLLDILYQIYPKELAEETFERITKEEKHEKS